MYSIGLNRNRDRNRNPYLSFALMINHIEPVPRPALNKFRFVVSVIPLTGGRGALHPGRCSAAGLVAGVRAPKRFITRIQLPFRFKYSLQDVHYEMMHSIQDDNKQPG